MKTRTKHQKVSALAVNIVLSWFYQIFAMIITKELA